MIVLVACARSASAAASVALVLCARAHGALCARPLCTSGDGARRDDAHHARRLPAVARRRAPRHAALGRRLHAQLCSGLLGAVSAHVLTWRSSQASPPSLAAWCVCVFVRRDCRLVVTRVARVQDGDVCALVVHTRADNVGLAARRACDATTNGARVAGSCSRVDATTTQVDDDVLRLALLAFVADEELPADDRDALVSAPRSVLVDRSPMRVGALADRAGARARGATSGVQRRARDARRRLNAVSFTQMRAFEFIRDFCPSWCASACLRET